MIGQSLTLFAGLLVKIEYRELSLVKSTKIRTSGTTINSPGYSHINSPNNSLCKSYANPIYTIELERS